MMNRLAALFLLAGTVVVAEGCVPTSSIQPVQSFSELSDDEMIIVGRVELDPPLRDGEQDIGPVYDEFRNTAILVTDNELRGVNRLALGDMSERIDAKFGDTFFVRRQAEPFWILKGWVVMKVESTEPGNAPLDGVFRVNAAPDDKAVYIGTIRYHRDDFFGTEKVEVIDEFSSAKAEFQRQFGPAVPLRKSLARPLVE